MLTTVQLVRAMPGMSNVARLTNEFLAMLIADADAAVKAFLKQNVEMAAYTEYYDGNEFPDIVLRQVPVVSAITTVDVASNGVALPTATINVASTTGFHQTPIDPSNPPTISVQTGTAPYSQTTVTYTGTTATSFTGCAGGTGTLATDYQIGTPTVFFDPQGNYGETSGSFAANTQLVLGSQYAMRRDRGNKSHRGLLERLGGGGIGPGFAMYPGYQWVGGGKLAAYRKPCWPRGNPGNLKVQYSAGYAPTDVPKDIQYATTMLVAFMVRNMPQGMLLNSESLGAYSYSMGQVALGMPELGTVTQSLKRYRDVCF